MKATVRVDARVRLGTIDRRLYGFLLEHLGRAVYGGIFDPRPAYADQDGLRSDVLAACAALGPSVLRWPGGNFASGYHWRDGVGPADQRPTRHDLAWDGVDDNSFGTEEFLRLCARLNAEPYLAVNASTGTIDEALGWLEYCNGVHPLPEVALRRQGPHPDPHGVRLWGIGNENYGWWQHLHTSSGHYGDLAREWGKLLRWADPSAQIVAVGAADPEWNWNVLTRSVRFIDLLSLHFYWHGDGGSGGDNNFAATLAGPIGSEEVLTQTYSFIQAARRREGLTHPVRIAVDEWGVWTRTVGPLAHADDPTHGNEIRGQGLSARSGVDTSFEENYDVKDALAYATWLHVMWRHPEKVGLAAASQLVNVLAPVRARPDGWFRQTIYWPLAFAAQYAGSESVEVRVVTGDEVTAPGTAAGALPVLDAAATVEPRSGRRHLSLVNRSRTDAVEVTLEGVGGEARLLVLTDTDPFAGNTWADPDRVGPRERFERIDARLTVPPASHTTLIFE